MVDINPNPRPGPALSATSDMPVFNPPTETEAKPTEAVEAVATEAVKPAAEVEAKPEAVAETPEAKAAAEAKVAADAAAAAAAKVAEKTAAEKRADHAVARRAAEQEAKEANERLAKALELVDRLTRQDNEVRLKQAEDADPKPKREQFDTPDAHEKALEDWAVRSYERKASAKAAADKVAADAKASEAKTAKEKADKDAADQTAPLVTAWNERVTKAKAEHADYDEMVTNNSGVSISNAAFNCIFAADNGPEIAYYLGKNPAEAARISAIQNPVIVAMEIGKLSLAAAPKPQIDTAPKPINTNVRARAAAGKKTDEEMNGDEYYEAHKNDERHLRGRRGGGVISPSAKVN